MLAAAPVQLALGMLASNVTRRLRRGVASEVVMAHTARSALVLQGGGALGAYEYGTRIVLSLGRVTF